MANGYVNVLSPYLHDHILAPGAFTLYAHVWERMVQYTQRRTHSERKL